MELFLIAVDKFINTPKAFSVVILVGILVIICINSYKKHVSRNIYPDREFLRVNRRYLRKMLGMFALVSIFTEIILSYSNYMHNDYTNQPFLFIMYSIPLFALTVCQNVAIIMKEDNFSCRKAILAVLPGSSFYILFYCSLSAANKGVWILAVIAILGVIIPSILDVGTVFLVSEKSKIKIKIYDDNGNIYDVDKKDFIQGGKEVTIKVRDSDGRVCQSIFINNDKIIKKEYYRAEKNFSIDNEDVT